MPRSRDEVGWLQSIGEAYYGAQVEGVKAVVHRRVGGIEHIPGPTCPCGPVAYDPRRVSLLDIMRDTLTFETRH